MSANIWQPGGEVVIESSNNVLVEEFNVANTAQTTFTLTNFSYTLGTNSLEVYLNGVRQRVNVDYVESSESSFTFISHTFVTGDSITAVGQVALVTSPSNPFGTSTEVQIATSGQTVFTITSNSYIPNNGSLRVYINGLLQEAGSSYIESSGGVVFSEGLEEDAKVMFSFNSEIGIG